MLSVPVAHPGTDGMGASEEGLGAKPLPRYGGTGAEPSLEGSGSKPPSKAEA